MPSATWSAATRRRTARRAPLIVASHYDTVRNAGKYDGRLGVLVALALVEELQQLRRKLPFHLDVIAFSEEEGVRFSSSFLGSSAVAGRFDPRLLERRDADGRSLDEVMREAGLEPDKIPSLARRADELAGYLEVHIEQGPVLLQEELPVGIVNAIAGSVRFKVAITGTAGHAGTVPMGQRHDAAAAAAELVLYVEKRCAQAPTLVGTVGELTVPDGAINIIPGRCELSLDIRAAADEIRDAAVRDIMAEIARIGERRGVAIESREVQRTAAVPLLAAPQVAAGRRGHARRDCPARACQRRRPRRHDVRRAYRHCDAVRALRQRRRQPFAARDHQRGGRRCRRPRHARYRAASRRSSMSLAAIVQDFVDREFAREVDFLAELVRVPSDNPPGDCAPHAQKARQLLQQLGLVVEAHPVPRADVEAAGMRSVTNLIVRQRFDDGPVIALNAHGDVVPPGLGWRLDPYAAAIEDGPHGPVMYGRGVAVSKSDFATYAWTLLALRQPRPRGSSCVGTLELHFTYDEEAGGMLGPKWLLDQRPDQTRCGHRRRLRIFDRDRAQWLSASRSEGHGQAGPRGDAGNRRRCTRGRHRNPERTLRAARASFRAGARTYPASSRPRSTSV